MSVSIKGPGCAEASRSPRVPVVCHFTKAVGLAAGRGGSRLLQAAASEQPVVPSRAGAGLGAGGASGFGYRF